MAGKKLRFTTVSTDTQQNHNTVETLPAAQLPTCSDQAGIVWRPSSLDTLPLRMLGAIGEFAAGGESSLSGASKTTLEAIREVHLKIDTVEKYRGFHPEKALIAPTGALKSGRVVVHITATSAIDYRESEVRVCVTFK